MRKDNYVVGFEGQYQCIYGKDENTSSKWVQPLTLIQAKKQVRELCTSTSRRCIYKLVKVSSIV